MEQVRVASDVFGRARTYRELYDVFLQILAEANNETEVMDPAETAYETEVSV